MKKLIGMSVAVMGLVAIGGCDVAVGNLCSSGEKSCGGGCINNSDDCCDPAGDYCSYPYVCDGNNSCVVSNGGNNTGCDTGLYKCGSGCISLGEPCCNEALGLYCQLGDQCCGTGCVPLASVCCPSTNTYCAIGQVCVAGGCES